MLSRVIRFIAHLPGGQEDRRHTANTDRGPTVRSGLRLHFARVMSEEDRDQEGARHDQGGDLGDCRADEHAELEDHVDAQGTRSTNATTTADRIQF